uniref:Beta-hexosaminidase n=1 Tax=Anopheles atroparvus TaxID=41427 RepID=A0A182IRJ1_ANOAO
MKVHVCSYLLWATVTYVLGTSLYICVNDQKCITKHVQTHESNTSTIFYSLTHCRLLCGQYGPLWPKPTGIVILDKKTITVHPSNMRFSINNVNQSSAVIKMFNETVRYFLKNIHRESKHICSSKTSLLVKVNVTTAETVLNWSTNESYKLQISLESSDTTNVTVEATTIYGVRHAVETLLQLMVSVKTDMFNSTCSTLYMLKNAMIHDQPVYPHRGLLIDTARNYIPIKTLRKQIDAMASCKMNVLHWHVSDTQSFPIVVEHVPEFSSYGAYSAEAIFTHKDVQDLVQYAKYRGIRVILEFDAPSHAGNGWQWGPSRGLGNLALCVNQQPWRSFCVEPPCGQLNPVNPNMYNILQQLYRSFAAMNNEEEILHMGGDEVFFGCWNASEEVVNYMRDKGMNRTEHDFLQLWSEFQNTSLRLWENARFETNRMVKKTIDPAPVILWSSQLTHPSVIDRFLNNSRYIIQTWVPAESDIPNALQKKGYKLIVSTKDAWYLDHGFWGQTSYYSWKKVYQNRLPRGIGILGGEDALGHVQLQQQSDFGQIRLPWKWTLNHAFSGIETALYRVEYAQRQ